MTYFYADKTAPSRYETISVKKNYAVFIFDRGEKQKKIYSVDIFYREKNNPRSSHSLSRRKRIFYVLFISNALLSLTNMTDNIIAS
jgi:hypothetical protein